MIWLWFILTAAASNDPIARLECLTGFRRVGEDGASAAGATLSGLPRNEPTKLTFEKKAMPFRFFESDAAKGVSYLGPALVETCRVTVKDGRLYDDRGDLLQRGPDTIFVMAMDGSLFVYNPRSLTALLINHSSFTSGKGVASAGRMEVVDGLIVWADAKSGHYHPEKRHFLQLRARLEELGYDLPYDRLSMLHGTTPLAPD